MPGMLVNGCLVLRLFGFAVVLWGRGPAKDRLFAPLILLVFTLCAAIASPCLFLPTFVDRLARTSTILFPLNRFIVAPVMGLICRFASPIHLNSL
jgi:ABC-type Na+ efflux pump permease subunit